MACPLIQSMRWIPDAPMALPSASIIHHTSFFDSPIRFTKSSSCCSDIGNAVPRKRVTSVSANHSTNSAGSFSCGGRSVTFVPFSTGPNMERIVPAGAGGGAPATSRSDLRRERGLQEHLIAALLADVELRSDAREVDAQRVRRDAEALGEPRAVQIGTLATDALELAEDAELAPRQPRGTEVERRLVQIRCADGHVGVALRAPERALTTGADGPRERARRIVALGRATEPDRDLGQVIGEALAVARADVAHEIRRSRRAGAAHGLLAPVRGVDRRADGPVLHAA